MPDVVTLAHFENDGLGFEAENILLNTTQFNASDVEERIRRAHRYSSKCRQMRSERKARMIEFVIDATFFLVASWFTVCCFSHLMGG